MTLNAIPITHEMLTSKCPMRPDSGHKGTFGRALLYAGSVGMGGAAYMAASSALRSGVGLVYILTERALLAPLMTMCPEALGLSFPEGTMPTDMVNPLMRVRGGNASQASFLAAQLEGKDACLIGPGVPPERSDLKVAMTLFADKAPKLVLDAGALTHLASDEVAMEAVARRREIGMAPAVLTPHIGEFQRLFPAWQPGDLSGASAFAVNKGVVLVLKSNETNIFTPDGKWYSNPKGNSGLAKGGSGDVLAGLLTGFLAQGMTPEDAAICAVGIHSLAGELCAKEHGKRAMLPTMLWEYYGKCFNMLKWEEGMES